MALAKKEEAKPEEKKAEAEKGKCPVCGRDLPQS